MLQTWLNQWIRIKLREGLTLDLIGEWMKPAREAAKQICKQRFIEFGCEGQAGKIKGENLQVVATKYAKGELAQTVN